MTPLLELPFKYTDTTPAFYAIALQSGSNGNCIYVRAGDAHLFFDAGISGVEAQRRFARHQLEVPGHGKLFISHEHSDHARCAGVFHRKFGFDLHMTPLTHDALQRGNKLGELSRVHFFQSGDTIPVGDIAIDTIPTPHDGIDGVAFIIRFQNKQLGIFTDLGHPFKGLQELICTLDGVFLESNYDMDMLIKGPYPYPLKKRITDSAGHISNVEAANLLKTAFQSKLKWAVLSHLSGENNTPQLALATHQQIVGEDKPVFVARRDEVSPIFTL
ncbi:MAG: MBL fold metallo-hydrolase [Deltaproteobacteria bacterium]|nr:MBL fold metallo-hydrolase [Deltaproteobacteria bacterium]